MQLEFNDRRKEKIRDNCDDDNNDDLDIVENRYRYYKCRMKHIM